jgi:hypothetical protein
MEKLPMTSTFIDGHGPQSQKMAALPCENGCRAVHGRREKAQKEEW